MSLTLLERAAALIRDLDGHEGAEGWSADTRKKLDSWMQEFRANERARIRTMAAVAWHAVEPQEIGLSWVEVCVYGYRWGTATVEGWGNAVIYYDTDARCFYRKLQDGHVGYGRLRWHKGVYHE